jgi:hypothetical protein
LIHPSISKKKKFRLLKGGTPLQQCLLRIRAAEPEIQKRLV